MFYKPLLLPILIQVALTFAVMLRMYATRIREMRAKRIDPQAVATRARGRAALTDSAASADNFANLFETPVLFYLAMVLALVLMVQDPVMVALAWMYVVLRCLHSVIHTTYNTVLHRFWVFVMSCVALLGIWLRLGWYILSH